MAKRPPKHVKAQRDYKKAVNCHCAICNSSTNLETHHLNEYAYQGSANPENFITLCHEHHRMVHDGEIDIIVMLD